MRAGANVAQKVGGFPRRRHLVCSGRRRRFRQGAEPRRREEAKPDPAGTEEGPEYPFSRRRSDRRDADGDAAVRAP